MEKKQDKRIIWQYSIVQILYWGGYGAYNGFQALLILLRPGFALTLLLVLGLGVFELNSASLLNSIALKYIEAGSSLRYSLARGMGSMALAVSGAFMGIQAKHCGVESILITRLAIVSCFAIFVLTLPVCSAHLADEPPANGAAPGTASSKAALSGTGPILSVMRYLRMEWQNCRLHFCIFRSAGDFRTSVYCCFRS